LHCRTDQETIQESVTKVVSLVLGHTRGPEDAGNPE
jgi:hypothetical protein